MFVKPLLEGMFNRKGFTNTTSALIILLPDIATKQVSLFCSHYDKQCIRKADFVTDLSWMMSTYSTYSSRFNGTIVRSNEKYWTQWIVNEPATYFILEDGNVRGDHRVLSSTTGKESLHCIGIPKETSQLIEREGFLCHAKGI